MNPPQELIEEISRYAIKACERWAKAQAKAEAEAKAKEEHAKALAQEGQIVDRGPVRRWITQRQQAKDLLRQGLSESEVMDQTGFGFSHVQRLRLAMGIYKNPLDQSKIFAVAFSLMNTSKPYAQIAADHGIGVESVKHIAKNMRAAGLKVTDRPRGRPRRQH